MAEDQNQKTPVQEQQVSQPEIPSKVNLNTKWKRILGAYLSLVTIAITVYLIIIWDSPSLKAEQNVYVSDTLKVDSVDVLVSMQVEVPESLVVVKRSELLDNNIEDSQTILIIIILVGALGASLHGLVSLGEYAGNKSFDASWASWYAVRPFVGGVLSLLFYFVVRGGFFSNANEFDSNDFYVIVAMASLVGLFSKQALYKLSDIFDVVFRSNKEKYLKDKIERNPLPDIESIDPNEYSKSKNNLSITIKGNGFIKDSQVTANDIKLESSFVNSNQVTAEIKDLNISSIAAIEIKVINPPPEGGSSNPYPIKLVD